MWNPSKFCPYPYFVSSKYPLHTLSSYKNRLKPVVHSSIGGVEGTMAVIERIYSL